MARVRPFAAYRYRWPGRDITPLTAPPYDVISEAQREKLIAGDVHNVVALELPEGPLDASMPGSRYENGAATWRRWRDEGVVAQDPAPAIYVLEQRFVQHGRPIRRRAFIAAVGLEPFEAGIVLPHERTLPKALGDRFELTKATAANLSQVLGLYDDPAGETDSIFDTVVATDPVSTAKDADGVESVLWKSDDPQVAAALEVALADRRIFIADGHHRYTTALAYRDMRREEAQARGETAIDPPYDFVMMALVNMDDPELVVMPTHRVADADGPFDPSDFYERLERSFVLCEAPAEKPWNVLEQTTTPGFLVRTRADARPRLALLRDDVDLEALIPLDRSAAWKRLDVAILQEVVLDPMFGIHPDRPETLDRLTFVKGAEDALAAVGTHDVAFILRPTRMNQLRDVAIAGETMPQKSTYFYPKLLSGLVFRSAE